MPRETATLIDERISLGGGKEKHYGPFHLVADSFLRLRSDTDARVYAGIFDADEYADSRRRNPRTFPFPFGSDRKSWNLSVNAVRDEDFWVVVRVGVFTGNAVVACRIERVGPDLPVSGGPPTHVPSSVSWVTRLVGSIWSFIKSRIFQASGTVAVAIADYFVLRTDGPTNFFAALTAEGTISLALVTAYFGVMRSGSGR